MAITDWSDWHREYDAPGSELVDRLGLVQELVRAQLAGCTSGTLTIVSICAGQGREVLGALGGHPHAGRARAWLIELDAANAAEARRRAAEAGLDGVTVVQGDASSSDTYGDADRADLVVMSGVLGHLDDADQERTIAFLPELCRTGATVVWTTYEQLTERITATRARFAAHDFEETSAAVTQGGTYGVVAHRYAGDPRPLEPRRSIFRFGSSWPPRDVPEHPQGLYPSQSRGTEA